MRARNIKPGFYKNEKLVECSTWARLLAPGLWMLADKEGRLHDKPKQIKMEIFPADSIDVEPLLQELDLHGHIIRYEIDNNRYIQILGFKEHQSPHYSEKDSIIPPHYSEKDFIIKVNSKKKISSSKDIPQPVENIPKPHPPDLLNPDLLNPDLLNNNTHSVREPFDKSRLQMDLPDGWFADCKQEMGWKDEVICDVWINFGSYYRGKIGATAFRTQEEWRAQWHSWYRGQIIKNSRNEKNNGATNDGQQKSQIERAIEATKRAQAAREQRSAVEA